MNEFAEAMIAFCIDQLGKPYVKGAKGPDEWDCRGLVRKAARAAELDATVVPASGNVREFVKWAQDNGHFRDASVTPERGWGFLWGPTTGDHKPVYGNGHIGLVLEAPSPAKPAGRAISAYNPARGVCEHRLIPKKASNHALYGYIAWPYPAAQVDPPISDPEEPPSSGGVDTPSAAELQARIDEAVEVLTK